MHSHFPENSPQPIPLAARVLAFISCRRCAIGWTAYLAIAAIIVAFLAD